MWILIILEIWMYQHCTPLTTRYKAVVFFLYGSNKIWHMRAGTLEKYFSLPYCHVYKKGLWGRSLGRSQIPEEGTDTAMAQQRAPSSERPCLDETIPYKAPTKQWLTQPKPPHRIWSDCEWGSVVTDNIYLKFSVTRTLALPSWLSINGIFFACQLHPGKSISVFCCLAWSWHCPGLAVGTSLTQWGSEVPNWKLPESIPDVYMPTHMGSYALFLQRAWRSFWGVFTVWRSSASMAAQEHLAQ